jgi:hypothetical protein
MNRLRLALAVLPSLLAIWLFLGIERVPDEHDTKYRLFIKARPTPRLFFRNPVTCGVCDVHPYESLTGEQKEEFATFCSFRFGLDRSNECFAIFAEQQRSADEVVRAKAPAGK